MNNFLSTIMWLVVLFMVHININGVSYDLFDLIAMSLAKFIGM